MPDLVIVLVLITLFLFLPLLSPYVKALCNVEGFVYLPLIALFCAAAVFPAYGFRPECVPLLLFTIVYNLFNARALAASIFRLNDSGRGFIYFFVMTFFISASVFIALRYHPWAGTELLEERQSVEFDFQNNNEYCVKAYGGVEAGSEKIILAVPPVAGSKTVIDRLCASLSYGGKKVISFSRNGFDFPSGIEKPVYPPRGQLKKMIFSFLSGYKNREANTAGRFFEGEREKDITFMMSFIKEKFHPREVYILGYGAGASALIKLLGDENWIKEFPEVKCAVAVGGRLLSFYNTEGAGFGEDEYNAGGKNNFFQGFFQKIKTIAAEKAKKNLPVSISLPEEKIPLLYVGEYAMNLKNNSPKFKSVSHFLDRNKSMVRAVSFEGASVVDFTDVTEKYPIISALADGGGEREWSGSDCTAFTSKLILDFIDEN